MPESSQLGGFGFDIDGALYNIDTLKFYEALIALDRAGVLGELRAAPGRPVVWEIGAGWGGFAYQVKTLFPDVTYVICDLPELFLFSATYLMTLFPDASVLFADPDRPAELSDADFVFVPEYGARGHPRPRRPRREHGVLPGDDDRAGRRVRRPRRRAGLPAGLQPQPRAVALQPRADQRARADRRALRDRAGGRARRPLQRHARAALARASGSCAGSAAADELEYRHVVGRLASR